MLKEFNKQLLLPCFKILTYKKWHFQRQVHVITIQLFSAGGCWRQREPCCFARCSETKPSAAQTCFCSQVWILSRYLYASFRCCHNISPLFVVVSIYWHNDLLILKIQDQGITIMLRRGWDLRVQVESRWNVMTHGDARKGKWKGKWRMEWVASTRHTTSEHGVSSITTADTNTSAASSRLNWCPPPLPGRFKRTGPFRRKTKSGFCACAITFQTQSTHCNGKGCKFRWPLTGRGPYCANLRC